MTTFEDLSVGDELEPRVVEDLRGDDMKLVAALLQDPYPPHFNERHASELDYPGLLNQGPANLSYLLQTVVRSLESPTDLSSFDVRFHDRVFEHETVTATATVEDKHKTDEGGIVEFALELEKADGTVAVDGKGKAHFPPSDSVPAPKS